MKRAISIRFQENVGENFHSLIKNAVVLWVKWDLWLDIYVFPPRIKKSLSLRERLVIWN